MMLTGRFNEDVRQAKARFQELALVAFEYAFPTISDEDLWARLWDYDDIDGALLLYVQRWHRRCKRDGARTIKAKREANQ